MSSVLPLFAFYVMVYLLPQDLGVFSHMMLEWVALIE